LYYNVYEGRENRHAAKKRDRDRNVKGTSKRTAGGFQLNAVASMENGS